MSYLWMALKTLDLNHRKVIQAPTEYVLTCHECGHFHPAVNSPNPAQAWGHCEKRNKGRYGVGMGCEGLVQAELFPGREEGREAL